MQELHPRTTFDSATLLRTTFDRAKRCTQVILRTISNLAKWEIRILKSNVEIHCKFTTFTDRLSKNLTDKIGVSPVGYVGRRARKKIKKGEKRAPKKTALFIFFEKNGRSNQKNKGRLKCVTKKNDL